MRSLIFFLTDCTIKHILSAEDTKFVNEVIWQIFNTSHQQQVLNHNAKKNKITNLGERLGNGNLITNLLSMKVVQTFEILRWNPGLRNDYWWILSKCHKYHRFYDFWTSRVGKTAKTPGRVFSFINWSSFATISSNSMFPQSRAIRFQYQKSCNLWYQCHWFF